MHSLGKLSFYKRKIFPPLFFFSKYPKCSSSQSTQKSLSDCFKGALPYMSMIWCNFFEIGEAQALRKDYDASSVLFGARIQGLEPAWASRSTLTKLGYMTDKAMPIQGFQA
jgi:hypothetical protein